MFPMENRDANQLSHILLRRILSLILSTSDFTFRFPPPKSELNKHERTSSYFSPSPHFFTRTSAPMTVSSYSATLDITHSNLSLLKTLIKLKKNKYDRVNICSFTNTALYNSCGEKVALGMMENVPKKEERKQMKRIPFPPLCKSLSCHGDRERETSTFQTT